MDHARHRLIIALKLRETFQFIFYEKVNLKAKPSSPWWEAMDTIQKDLRPGTLNHGSGVTLSPVPADENGSECPLPDRI